MARSLDALEKEYFNPGPAPFEGQSVYGNKCKEKINIPQNEVGVLSLNGQYEMIDGGTVAERTDLSVPWSGSVSAEIPCTVHTALFENGIIPDPLYAKNDKIAREHSYKTWWFKKEFDYNENFHDPRLCFDGVCYSAVFWLNGVFLGSHIGMFGGPEFHIKHLLKPHNTLIVKVENAPADPRPYSEYADHDEGWKYGVVVNCVYGWHYACIPSRGIWAPVWIKETPRIPCERPFLVTKDYENGIVDLCVRMPSKASGKVFVKVTPKNFKGEDQYFEAAFDSQSTLHYSLKIEDFRLWWPNGYGEQNLYTFEICIALVNDLKQTFTETFGIRKIEMLPIPTGEREDLYNWTFNINGKSIFLKGTNWCTTDALLRFSEERYDRFLSLAKHQNLQLLRAWGGGMPESDYFYEKCDELGLMVAQEWPTCWDSQKIQPMEALVETALIHTVRLRNHPSLVQWAGGNESQQADGDCMDALARIAFTLDGTRPFHRTSPYGGSLHNYDTYWDMEEMDNALNLRAVFMGEFGMASAPNLNSIKRYVPAEELETWDVTAKNSFNYHTPRFNEFRWPEDYNDMDHLLKRSSEFFDITSYEEFALATQLAQATAIRHTLEAFRANWPNSTGICYYKLTDVYPACSWATIDYYGVPKIPYYVFKNAFAPLHVALIIKSIQSEGIYPLYLLDDRKQSAGKNCKIELKFYDSSMCCIEDRSYSFVATAQVEKIEDVKINESTKNAVPLFISVKLFVEDVLCDSNFYIQNYKNSGNALKELPKTSVTLKVLSDSAILVKNTGAVAAAGVMIENIDHATKFVAEDNFLFLEAGEERICSANITAGITVTGFNV